MKEIFKEEPIEGVPVEFKQINKKDFNSFYNVEDKIVVGVNEEGYLDENFMSVLDGDSYNTNTTIINAGVGQGKSKRLIQKAISFANEEDYIVVVAVPFNSLIKQYYDELCSQFDKYRVFSMLDIENAQFLYPEKKDTNVFLAEPNSHYFRQDKISNYKIHIMTTNSLLGNSGEEVLFQSRDKREYFQKLITLCKHQNKKIVIIFDEIHDCIHNFKEQYIINFWKFYGLVHKIYIVSATFNEASKEVVKYLSEFTDRNIKIIESERTIKPNKQSNLHLIFNDSSRINSNEHLRYAINTVIYNKQPFDIIVYSKKQVDQLLSKDSKIELLVEMKGDLNICYTDIFSYDANNKYSSEKINIGTNFTTGVNIEKDNHHLFIILPKRLNAEFINNKGIFNSGINSIIQSFARQRRIGDIYVVLSIPYMISEDSIPYEESIKAEIIKRFRKFNTESIVDYSNINHQDIELNEVYERLLKNSQEAINSIQSLDRTGMNSLEFPNKERFIIERGEKYLTNNFFGGDLSSYVYFAAITNQFLNCKLATVSLTEDLYYESESLTLDLLIDYQNHIFNFPLAEGKEFYTFEDVEMSKYETLKLLLSYYLNRRLHIDKKKDNKRSILQIMILYVIYDSLMDVDDIYRENKSNEIISKYYFQSCVKYSSIAGNLDIQLSDTQSFLAEFFNKWSQFLEIINTSISEARILSKSPSNDFIELFNSLDFDSYINRFTKIDLIVKNGIINFHENWKTKISSEKRINFFYKTLVETFYNYEDRQVPQENGTRPRLYTNVVGKDLNEIYNLLYEV